MGHTLLAFRATQQSTPLVRLNSVTEQIHRQSGNDYIVPSDMNKIQWIYANGANIARARIQSPSILRKMPAGVEIAPLDISASPTSPQGTVMDLVENPMVLDNQEALSAYIANDNNSEYETILVSLTNGNNKLVYQVPGGGLVDISKLPKMTLRATGTTTISANAWTLASMTYSSIPSGKYAIVGMKPIGATCLGGRLVIPGYNWRPGTIGSVAESSQDWKRFSDGSLGIYGVFDHLNPPNLEMLCTAADTAQTLYLYCVKIA